MTYIFDGTINGFLTAFLQAFAAENARLIKDETQLLLGEEPCYVTTNVEKATKAKLRLCCFDRQCMHDLDFLLRSGETDASQTAFLYFKLLATKKTPIRNNFAEPSVFRANTYIKKVSYEIHRMHGFLRFTECASGALYAPFTPDNDICDLLLPHFRARLPQYPFVLHDVSRKKAAVYDGKNTFVAPLPAANVLLSAKEESWKSLWKRYYAAVNIPERERLEQMRGYLPVRYRSFMTEFEK
jgi:probable DNA metabolism protein